MFSVALALGMVPACASEAPPLALGTAPAAPASSPAVTDRAPAARAPAPIGESSLDALRPMSLLGPLPRLEDLCGASCRIARKLEPLAPAKRVVVAMGTDRLSNQPPSVTTTYLAFELDTGWSAVVLFHEGNGSESVEIFNPPDINGGAPVRADRPVKFAGAMKSAAVETSDDGREKFVAAQVTRADPLTWNVLVLCGFQKDDGLACAELVNGETYVVGEHRVVGNALDVAYTNGERGRFSIFP